MTCVLPYRNCNQRRFRPHTMPCVFDGCEPLDFESALLSGDWPTPTKDNTHNTATYGEEEPERATSGSPDKNLLKRKYADDEETNRAELDGTTEPKKPCVDKTTVESSSTFTESCVEQMEKCEMSSRSDDDESAVHNHHQEVASQTSMEEDDDIYMPRRRVPQMWNSRQRWKDERKKVLKLSVNKLTEIEDPELWLLRSVLINNTIKRLHQDIRTERQAKIRHRQQKMDFYSNRYEPPTPLHQLPTGYDQVEGSSSSTPTPSSYEDLSGEDAMPKITSCVPSDIYEENSCDEIFGINEDFLRVTSPDRRVSTPLPTNPVQDDDHDIINPSSHHNIEHQNDPSTQMDVDQSSSESASSTSSVSPCSTSSDDCDTPSPSSSSSSTNNSVEAFRRAIASHQTGSQCATQFRTNNNNGLNNVGGIGEVGVFPPRVPILDSVVYHSLLASLESS